MAQPSASLLQDPTAASAAATNSTPNSGDQADATQQGTNSAYGVSVDPTTNSMVYSVNTNVANNPYLQGDISAINNQAATVQGQKAATATTPSQSLVSRSAGTQSAPTAVNQQGFNAQAQALQMAQQQAAGGGPAAAAVQAQTQAATNQGINAQLALAGSARGGNAGEMARQAAVGQAQVTGQAGAQAAANSLAAQQTGQQNLGNLSTSMQGEALNQAQLGQQNNQFNATTGQQNNQFNAGATNAANMQTQSLGNQTAIANAAGTNQFTQQQDAQIQSLMNSGMSLEQAQQQANVQMAQYATGSQADQYAAAQGHAISQQNADTGSANAAISGLSTAANIAAGIGEGAGGSVSDRRAKKNVKSAEKESSAFLDHLAAKEWNYKDPDKHGHGRHLGVMAQSLEKSKMGRGMVEEGEDGVKMVNYGGARGMAAIVASLAHLNSKIKELEKMKAKR